HWVAWLARPAVWLLTHSIRGLLRLLGLDKSEASSVIEEEIRLLVSYSNGQGMIDADERKMMNRMLDLGDRTTDSLMTPRTRIAWLDAEAALEENLAILRASPFSRFPVYTGDDRPVVGVVEAKSLLR